MSDTLYHLMMIYGKQWWDMSLKEQEEALSQYIFGDDETMRRQTSDL